MRQTVNLYQQASSATLTSLLNWRRLWLSSLALIGFFFLMYLITKVQIFSLERERDKLLMEEKSLHQRFTTLRNSYPASFFNADSAQAITQLQRDLKIQEDILRSIKNRTAFSENLLVLAKIIVPNVWLNNINLEKGGNLISLKGQSIGMENLQLFISKLMKEPIYKDYMLQVNNIENPSKVNANSNLIFEITITRRT